MLAPPENPAHIFRPRTTIEPDGTVEGYASLFGELDAARDMVMPGAFTRTLKSRGLRRIPMLFQHDPAEPIAIWLELTEDFRGLRARGKLIPEVARARELFALVRNGAVDGLSIGFRTVKGRIDPATRVRAVKGSVSSPPRRHPRGRAPSGNGRRCGVAPPPQVARIWSEAECGAVEQLERSDFASPHPGC